jgi:hypothetical protein
MSSVTCTITVSLDGFVAGPNQRLDNPIGEGGDRLRQSIWNESSTGWWREDPPYHTPVFVLIHHPLHPVDVVGSPAVTHVRSRVVR